MPVVRLLQIFLIFILLLFLLTERLSITRALGLFGRVQVGNRDTTYRHCSNPPHNLPEPRIKRRTVSRFTVSDRWEREGILTYMSVCLVLVNEDHPRAKASKCDGGIWNVGMLDSSPGRQNRDHGNSMVRLRFCSPRIGGCYQCVRYLRSLSVQGMCGRILLRSLGSDVHLQILCASPCSLGRASIVTTLQNAMGGLTILDIHLYPCYRPTHIPRCVPRHVFHVRRSPSLPMSGLRSCMTLCPCQVVVSRSRSISRFSFIYRQPLLASSSYVILVSRPCYTWACRDVKISPVKSKLDVSFVHLITEPLQGRELLLGHIFGLRALLVLRGSDAMSSGCIYFS